MKEIKRRTYWFKRGCDDL